MALTERNGIWHWRKVVQGHTFARSTKTGDKKLAEQIAALWEAEAIKEVVLKGTKPVLLHSVIKAFLDARKGTGGHANAQVHLKHFLALPNVRMGDLTLAQVQGVIQKRRDAGASHNTLAVSVSYWNAVVKFSEAQKWASAVRLPRMYPEKTRLRYLSHEEEAALFTAIDPNAKYPGKCARTDKARQDNTDLLVGLLHTGARYREIARMTWAQVDLEGRKVRIHRQKGGVDSTLVMSDHLRAMFSRRKSDAIDQWVFPTKRRHNNNYAWLRAALARSTGSASTQRRTSSSAFFMSLTSRHFGPAGRKRPRLLCRHSPRIHSTARRTLASPNEGDRVKVEATKSLGHHDLRRVAAGLDRQQQASHARERPRQVLHGPQGRSWRLRGRQRRNQSLRGEQPSSQAGAVALHLHARQDERRAGGGYQVSSSQGQHRRRAPCTAGCPLPALREIWQTGRGHAAASLRQVPCRASHFNRVRRLIYSECSAAQRRRQSAAMGRHRTCRTWIDQAAPESTDGTVGTTLRGGGSRLPIAQPIFAGRMGNQLARAAINASQE
jgi:integrase